MPTKSKRQPKLNGPVGPKLSKLLQELSQEEIESGFLKAKHPMGKTVGAKDVRADLQQALVTGSLREALSLARKEQGVSLENIALQQGISKERASQIERAEARLELQTLLRHVTALNYELSLTLTPKDGKGETIVAKLGR
jgi:hypothetical protein